MAKYQSLSNQKKEEGPITGQLISLDSPSSSVIGKIPILWLKLTKMKFKTREKNENRTQ